MAWVQDSSNGEKNHINILRSSIALIFLSRYHQLEIQLDFLGKDALPCHLEHSFSFRANPHMRRKPHRLRRIYPQLNSPTYDSRPSLQEGHGRSRHAPSRGWRQLIIRTASTRFNWRMAGAPSSMKTRILILPPRASSSPTRRVHIPRRSFVRSPSISRFTQMGIRRRRRPFFDSLSPRANISASANIRVATKTIVARRISRPTHPPASLRQRSILDEVPPLRALPRTSRTSGEFVRLRLVCCSFSGEIQDDVLAWRVLCSPRFALCSLQFCEVTVDVLSVAIDLFDTYHQCRDIRDRYQDRTRARPPQLQTQQHAQVLVALQQGQRQGDRRTDVLRSVPHSNPALQLFGVHSHQSSSGDNDQSNSQRPSSSDDNWLSSFGMSWGWKNMESARCWEESDLVDFD